MILYCFLLILTSLYSDRFLVYKKLVCVPFFILCILLAAVNFLIMF